MKAAFLVAACLAATGACAQVAFNIHCLPQAQQDEIKDKVAPIVQAAEARRSAAAIGVVPGRRLVDLRAEREQALAAFTQCADTARQAKQSLAEACEPQATALRVATEEFDVAEGKFKEAVQAINREERQQLLALRAQLPSCPDNIKPDNAVIRK